MPAPKMIETAADRYRRIKAELAKGETLYDVKCPTCGMDWKAHRVGIDFWVTAGILPHHMVETMLTAQGIGDPQEAVRKMAAPEVVQSIVFASKVVKYTAADPVIVEDPKKPNEISQEEVLTCCYTRLLNWQIQGGDEATGLNTFPQE